MRYRIPADSRRKQIRKRAQAALFRRALSRTSCALPPRTVAHKPGTNCAQCRARSAALPSHSQCAVSGTTRSTSAVQSVRHAAHNPLPNSPPQVVQSDADATCLHPRVVQPPLAAMPQLSEKPRQGFATKKTTGKPESSVCNFTVTLGLQVAVVENGVRKTYRARYYNPATGRFLSRDPEDGQPNDPKTLHKYLYANGDPVNGIDPRGHAATIETLFTISDISSPVTVRAVVYTGLSVAGCFWGIYRSLEALLVERSLPTVVDGFFVVAGCTMTFFPLPAD